MNALEEVKNLWDIDLSNSCECRYCETCGIGTESELCDECQAPTRAMDYCDGACYGYRLEWLEELASAYAKGNGHEYLVLHGRGMGWTGASGHTDPIPATGKDLLDALTFSGEWRLRFTLDENNLLTIKRYSHDEPMGASFYAVPSNGEEQE